MMANHTTKLLTFATLLLLLTPDGLHAADAQSARPPRYEMTIFVDEGRGELNGHVFFGLSDGRTTIYQGWHSMEKLLAPFALGGGQVWNDAPLVECGWDVKKTYSISKAGYDRAREGVVNWNTVGRAWAVNHHCGDFVETIAQMAGVPINLPKRLTGRNRPELFGDYLRAQGGLVSAETFYVNGPVNTGTTIRRGDKITIRAGGLVSFGRLWAGGGGPAGVLNPFISPEYSYFTDVAHGALMARMRTPGADRLDGWWYVGAGGEWTASTDGTLELNVNDTDPGNNEGKFEVVINVCGAE